MIPLLLALLTHGAGCRPSPDEACATQPPDPYFGQIPPGREPMIFAPGFISMEAYRESGTTYSPDGLEFYFTRSEGSDAGSHTFVMVTRFEGGEWSPPARATFSRGPYDFEPTVSPDGERLYFNRYHDSDDAFRNGLWVVERQSGGAWGSPEFFRSGMYVEFGADDSVYFTVIDNMPDSSIVIMRGEGGEYTEPVELVSGINTAGFDAHATLGPGDDYMVLTSRREGGPDYNDLYLSRRDDQGRWTPARWLGDVLGGGWKMCPRVTPDGKYLMYASEGDVYWVDIGAVLDVE